MRVHIALSQRRRFLPSIPCRTEMGWSDSLSDTLTHQDSLPSAILPLWSVEMGIEYSCRSILDTLDCLRQELLKFFGSGSMSCPQIVPSSSFGEARIVRRRSERNVQLFVSGFGSKTVRVDEREGSLGCVPACDALENEMSFKQKGPHTVVIENDSKNRDFVAL